MSAVQHSPQDTARMAGRVRPVTTSIFATMSRLAVEHKAVNLSQGFPDFPAPEWLKEAAQEAIARNVNQYAVDHGTARLRRAVAAKAERRMGIGFDENLEVTVTSGATEAIFDTIQSLIDPGDEMIVFEPYYDSYVPSIQFAGGVPRFATLRAPDWNFDHDHLASLFNDRTKAILINTPHNPTGKVYTEDELVFIADLCKRHNALAITDEVYEFMVYDGNRHISIATLPGMRERTVTINSAAKTFSITGWKIGYALAPPDLTEAIRRYHQFVVFSSAAPLQEAVAIGMESAEERGYYETLQQEYAARMEKLMASLERAGLKPIRPQGTYFIMSDISGLGFKDDVEFAMYMTTQAGVACIPPSAFYQDPSHGAGLCRWCFAKSDATLQAAEEKLMAWAEQHLGS
ncbi:MAG: methionine aminotransferase [Chloroflexia bacterium]